MERLLAAEEAPPLDYTVFSVIIVTLCLVLVIEVLRHGLDVAASGNPFFQTVLELMYRELTTLGIVEFCIYLMHKYHENFNYAMEVVFVDVHFMLFYTALFNAIQSVLIRLVTTRRTNKTWIQTEDIDIGHYVAVRKEFDRVESEWKHLHLLHGTELAYSHSGSFLGNSMHDPEQEVRDISAFASVKRYLHDFSMKIRYPRLYFRKRKLVVPVRFHELRHHFIKQNGLSSKFKVSQYLKRSLTSVLLDFVHISSAAWIMIMALSILLYFICGIALNSTGDKVTVYDFLISAISSGAVLFLIVSFVVYLKMKTIISKILVMKLFVEDEEGSRKTFRGFTALQGKMKSYDQISLFWGGNPRIIIYMTQFMQFGYALALAAIFTYWNEFGKVQTKEILFSVILVGYIMYLHMLADILPWFTICTSLGQLVNKERLHETMAKMKLSEELRKAEAAAEAAEIEREISIRRKQVEEKVEAEKRRERELLRLEQHKSSESSQTSKKQEKTFSGGIRLMSAIGLRSSLEKSTQRHGKKKSVSDGVQLMSSLNSNAEIFHCSSKLSDAAAEQLGVTDDFVPSKIESLPVLLTNIPQSTSPDNFDGAIKPRRQKRVKSKSTGVSFMRSSLKDENIFMHPLPIDIDKREGSHLIALSELVNIPTECLPEISEMKVTSGSTDKTALFNSADNSSGKSLSREERKQRRKRMKCQSEGVFNMRSSLDTSEIPLPSSQIGELIDRQPKLEALTELVNVPVSELPEIPKKKKKSRLKSLSAGVSIMRVPIDQSATPIQPENMTSEPTFSNHSVVLPVEDDKELTDTRSVESVGGESDIDDVPDISEEVIVVRKKRWIETVDVAAVIQGHQYRILSLLLGPMACCFWVAMRVEGFDKVEGVLIDYQNTFNLPLITTFWVETAWYCMMLIEQFVTIIVFTRKHNSQEIMNSIMGLTIVSTCFALLIVAETKRCCVEDDSNKVLRLLAASSSTGKEYSDYDTAADITECSCGSFGSRIYGGLGTIEPFTFLMALYPLRTLATRPIVRFLRLNNSTEVAHESNEHHDNHHGPGPEVARNIWLSTIGSHADVAKTHGLFSVQVLYCMLGLDAPEQKSLQTQSAHENNSISQDPTNTNDKASELSGNQEDTVLINSLGVDFDDEEFIFPDSKLIRRMRRCERKMLPLLDTWMLVDVALTTHELVILEVPDDDLYSSGPCGALGDGGKGLSLKEAVIGRKVVGKFLIDEIDSIDIEHSAAIFSESEIRDVERNCQELGEFWQGCHTALTYDPLEMSQRWCNVDEDRLKIHFTGGCGTLYLRLFADLKEKEAGKDTLSTPTLLSNVGKETKIWCRTIARLCGVANLKMDLPHFGDSTGDDELGDFVRITERESTGIKQHRRRISTKISTSNRNFRSSLLY